MRILIILVLVLTGGYVSAHQWTPTYPKLKPSHITGVYTTKMELFNARKEISYYSIGVFDKDWKKVPFASTPSLLKVSYLDKRFVEVYLHKNHKNKAHYICSRSKILSSVKDPSIIASRICSKIK
jgi:hypothetical protein|tara:strand:+ start:182 stop:556 length:375 start_codon:yes stop_codon:yes gene_type:complete